MDEKEAAWLAGLIRDAAWHLEESPGLTIQVDGEPEKWIQIIPVAGEVGEHSGYLLNVPYQNRQGNPMHVMGQVGVLLPPDTATDSWEDNGFATLRLSEDIPLVALAYLIDDLLKKFLSAADDFSIHVQIEHGF